MTTTEAAQILALLKGAYPRQPINAATVKVYSLMLSDLDFDQARKAVLKHVATVKFFPSIAEIREQVVLEVTCIPDFDEAYAEVVDSIRRAGRYQRPRFSHPVISETVHAVGWNNLCDSTTPGVERAAFRDIYAAVKSRALFSTNVTPLLEAHESPKMLEGIERKSREF